IPPPPPAIIPALSTFIPLSAVASIPSMVTPHGSSPSAQLNPSAFPTFLTLPLAWSPPPLPSFPSAPVVIKMKDPLGNHDTSKEGDRNLAEAFFGSTVAIFCSTLEDGLAPTFQDNRG
ncbi:hypothetical protein AMTR_s00014p00040180, partial [Amborella trichopoda]